MPHFAAEELVERKMKTAGFEIPEGDVDTRERGHQDRAAAVESQAVGSLPQVFDVAMEKGISAKVRVCSGNVDVYSAS